MKIKAVAFDFAGVLGLDAYWRWLETNIPTIDTERDYFHEISLAVDCCEITREEFLDRISLKAKRPPAEIEREILAMIVVFPQMVSLLEKLKADGYRTALLSNFIFEWLDPILKKFGVYPLIDVPIISTSVRLRKPDEQIYSLLLERLEVSPWECLFIDDREVNLDAARALGIETLLAVDPEKLPEQILAKLQSA